MVLKVQNGIDRKTADACGVEKTVIIAVLADIIYISGCNRIQKESLLVGASVLVIFIGMYIFILIIGHDYLFTNWVYICYDTIKYGEP